MTTKINFPFNDNSFKRSITFSESLEDNPDVGSSTNKTEGSLISSNAMFNLFRWPPLIFLFKGLPTLMIYKEGQMIWRQSGELDANTIIGLVQEHLWSILSNTNPLLVKISKAFGKVYSKFGNAFTLSWKTMMLPDFTFLRTFTKHFSGEMVWS